MKTKSKYKVGGVYESVNKSGLVGIYQGEGVAEDGDVTIIFDPLDGDWGVFIPNDDGTVSFDKNMSYDDFKPVKKTEK